MPALGCEGAYETRGEAFGGRFGNGHPAVLLCEAAQLGEHDGFSIAALSHDEHEAARSAGAVVERLLEVLDDILSPNENRGHLAGSRLEGVHGCTSSKCRMLRCTTCTNFTLLALILYRHIPRGDCAKAETAASAAK